MQELISHIAKRLVAHPDAVQVKEVEADGGTVLELHVAESDLGKVIGKQGRTARAMRSLLRAALADDEQSLRLEIVE